MKILFVLLVYFFEANPTPSINELIMPGNTIFSKKQAKVIIQPGNPHTDKQEPIIVLSEKQWLSLSDKSDCPTPITRTQQQHVVKTHFGSLDPNLSPTSNTVVR